MQSCGTPQAAPISRRTAGSWSSPQRPEPGLLRVMTSVDHLPALLLGRRAEVLARNALLTEVLGQDLRPGSSFPRYLFTDRSARERITNWQDFAAAAVGGLRLELGRNPGDRLLTALVDELRAADPQVAGWWDERGVADRTSLVKQIAHPVAGDLRFHIEAVSVPQAPHQRLVIYTVEPGSPTAQVLPMLASWAVQDPATSR
ncbi:transcriptional regulator [Lentzea sp. NPDC092896]|uniref:MmyB family transcriptional regulator n=1 Tax=Lentzea sp. NPDC092896 TaxID=3364127 RepID=UPI00380D948D